MLYQDCGNRIGECIKYLKEVTSGTYEEPDYRNIKKFLDIISGLLDEKFLLTAKGKQFLRSEVHRIGQHRGWTVSSGGISEEDLIISARQTTLFLRQEAIMAQIGKLGAMSHLINYKSDISAE